MESNIQEIWKDIIGYEDTHQVSNFGRVKSKSRSQKHKSGSVFIKNERILKLNPGAAFNGYTTVALTKVNDKQYSHYLHRLVATSFIDNPYNKPFVNHKNGIKTDNRVENLEWCTASENIKHAFKIGIQNNEGINHPSHKLDNDQVLEIRKRYLNGESTYKIFKSADYMVSYTTIKDIVARRIWDHI